MQQATQHPLDVRFTAGVMQKDGSSQLLPTLLHLGRILWNELTTGGSCLAGLRHLALQPLDL